MSDKVSEPLGQQTPGVHEWRRSLRSPSPGRDQRSSHTKVIRSWTPSPSPLKSAVEPVKLRRSQSPSGSPGYKNKSKTDMATKSSQTRITVANTLKKNTGNMSGKQNKSTDDLAYIEGGYIKCLQRQIYFLELETSYLREQAKKATEIHPHMKLEAESMLTKLREMKSEKDKLDLEIKQKDFNMQVCTSEKERIEEVLKLEKENHQREKTLLTEELVTMKKEIDRLERELAHKNDEMMDHKDELDTFLVKLKNADMKTNSLKSELEQRIEQHNGTQAALQEKQAQLLTTEVQLREIEEKYISSSTNVKDKMQEELRSEIRILHQKLKEAELEAGHDRFLRDKIADDIASIVHENASLNQQLVEITGQLQREKELRDSTDQQHLRSIAEVTTLSEKLSETNILRDELKREQEIAGQYLKQLTNERASSEEYRMQINIVKSHLSELETMQKAADCENAQLRKEKILLVEHGAELHKKIENKDREMLSLIAKTENMETTLRSADLQKGLEVTHHSQKMEQFSNLADSMKSLAHSMISQTPHSAQVIHQTSPLY